MARVLIVTWAGGGNVPPAVVLGTRLAARGHDVRAIGSESLAARFEGEGIDYVARDVITEWDPAALARDVLAEARKVDVVVADYMLPAALSAAEAAAVRGVAAGARTDRARWSPGDRSSLRRDGRAGGRPGRGSRRPS